MPLVVAVLALVLRVWAPGPVTQTADEFAWLSFSDGFRTEVAHGDFAGAKVPDYYTTLPGVTTMWAGTLGYTSVALGHRLGLANAPKPLAGSVLRASRAVVALWCSIALGLLVAIASLLIGRRAALIAGVLLATEPFLVGHSDVLHTDAMVTMFGALSLVALLAGMRAGRPVDPAGDATDQRPSVGTVPVSARIPLIVLSGASGALAALTKLNAVPLVFGGAAVIIVVELLTRRRSTPGATGWRKAALRENAFLVTVWLLVALLVSFALWPALWVAPLEQIRLMRAAFDQLAHVQRVTYFRHHLTSDPGVTFYPVAMLFRMTPWFLVGSVISAFVVLSSSARGLRRSHSASSSHIVAATLLLALVPYAVAASLTSQKYDRYFLPVFPFLAISCGVVAAQAINRFESRRLAPYVLPIGVVVAALLAVSTLSHAPYAISYVDPLAGGQKRASRNILLGWGEGLEVLGASVRHREGRHCNDARIAGPTFFVVAYPLWPPGQLRLGRPRHAQARLLRPVRDWRATRAARSRGVVRRGAAERASRQDREHRRPHVCRAVAGRPEATRLSEADLHWRPRHWRPRRMAPSAGFEPAHTPPEGDALSPELRGRERRQ